MLTADDFFYNSDLSEHNKQDNRRDLDHTNHTQVDVADHNNALSVQESAQTASKSKKKEKKSALERKNIKYSRFQDGDFGTMLEVKMTGAHAHKQNKPYYNSYRELLGVQETPFYHFTRDESIVLDNFFHYYHNRSAFKKKIFLSRDFIYGKNYTSAIIYKIFLLMCHRVISEMNALPEDQREDFIYNRIQEPVKLPLRYIVDAIPNLTRSYLLKVLSKGSPALVTLQTGEEIELFDREDECRLEEDELLLYLHEDIIEHALLPKESFTCIPLTLLCDMRSPYAIKLLELSFVFGHTHNLLINFSQLLFAMNVPEYAHSLNQFKAKIMKYSASELARVGIFFDCVKRSWKFKPKNEEITLSFLFSRNSEELEVLFEERMQRPENAIFLSQTEGNESQLFVNAVNKSMSEQLKCHQEFGDFVLKNNIAFDKNSGEFNIFATYKEQFKALKDERQTVKAINDKCEEDCIEAQQKTLNISHEINPNLHISNAIEGLKKIQSEFDKVGTKSLSHLEKAEWETFQSQIQHSFKQTLYSLANAYSDDNIDERIGQICENGLDYVTPKEHPNYLRFFEKTKFYKKRKVKAKMIHPSDATLGFSLYHDNSELAPEELLAVTNYYKTYASEFLSPEEFMKYFSYKNLLIFKENFKYLGICNFFDFVKKFNSKYQALEFFKFLAWSDDFKTMRAKLVKENKKEREQERVGEYMRQKYIAQKKNSLR